MKRTLFNLLVAWSTVTSLIFPVTGVAYAAPLPDTSAKSSITTAAGSDLPFDAGSVASERTSEQPSVSLGQDEASSASLLPGWFGELSQGEDLGTGLMPGWMSSGDPQDVEIAPNSLGSEILPAWLNSPSQPLGNAWSNDLDSPGPGLCPPAVNLALQVIPPSYTVSFGNAGGDVYTVTVQNNSAISIPEVSLLVEPGAGFYYLGGTAAATSSISGTLVITDPGTTAPQAPFSLAVAASPAPPEKQLLPGEVITFTFKLATDAEAASGQHLTASLVSGDAPPETCVSRSTVIPTQHGTLTVSKSPITQEGSFGDVVTWTVSLNNTGLGDVYGAVFTDTPGAGYTGLSIQPAPSPVDLAPDASQIYTVTAQINSCTNLTNTVAATWSIGNVDGTATPGNPVTSEADILFVLDEPDIVVEVGPIPSQPYCGELNATVPVTVTNQGGAARNVILTLSTQNLSVQTDDPDWSVDGNTFTYLGGQPAGTMRGGEVVTFNLEIHTDRLCDTRTAGISFTPQFMDACLLLDYVGGAGGSSQLLAEEAPTLSLTKTAPDVIQAGEVFTYVVNVSGNNQQSIVDPGVTITDVVPSQLTILDVSTTRGGFVQDGQTILWTIPMTTAPGAYDENLNIRVQVPALGTGVCGAGGTIVNRVSASAQGCPDCAPLGSSAETTSYVQDFMGQSNHFYRIVPQIELCAPGDTQTIINHADINNGITWTGTIFTDTLGLGVFDQPLQVVPGTLEVILDGKDRTSDVVLSLGSPLTVDLSALGTFSATAQLTITYQVIAPSGSLPYDIASQTEYQFASITFGGQPATACAGGDVGYFGSYVTLNQGILGFSVTPGDIIGCRENTVVLNVSGPNDVTLTDQLKVTFTADPGDIFTPTQYTLGGSFIGATPTIERSDNVVTFTFPTNQDFDGGGSISFPLFRPCGIEAPLQADIQYQDRCSNVRTDSGVGGTTTLVSNVNLFVTPNQYTLNTRNAVWWFYVGNGSTVAAENVIVTNTLPMGHKFISATITSGDVPTSTVSIMTGTLSSGQEVVTYTISSLPRYTRLRFENYSRIDSLCNLPADIHIALFDECGQVEPNQTCQGRDEEIVTLLPGAAFLNTSNDQTARLPLCEVGHTSLVIKNASDAAEEFDFKITDYLTNATFIDGTAYVTVTDKTGQYVTGASSGLVLRNVPFPPSVTTLGNQQTLIWQLSDFAPGTPGYDVLVTRQAREVAKIDFQVRTGCSGTGAKVQSVGEAKDICSRPLPFTEGSKTLLVDAPELSLTKRGYNVTRGYPLDDQVYARPGDTIRWDIDVTNFGDQHVLNLFVTDTLPVNFAYGSSNLGGAFNGTNKVSWSLSSDPVLDVGQSIGFVITGTVQDNACTSDTQNQVYAVFACTSGDLCTGLPASASANLQTRPSVAALSSTGDLTNCGGDITVQIQNDGPPADQAVLTDTLPTGFVFESLVSATTAPDGLPSDGANPAVFHWTGANLLPSGTTTLVFHVHNSAASGACSTPASPLTNELRLEYDDDCPESGPYYADQTDSGTINLDVPVLVANQTPLTQSSSVGGSANWTLSIQNTGSAPAPNVVIRDRLADSFGSPSASDGSYGTTASYVGGEIVWSPAITIPAGGTWSATLTAQLLSAGANTNVLTATASCGSRCQYVSTSRTAYVTLLDQFAKTPAWQSGAIGDLQVFQFSASLSDLDALYAGLTLSDTLPSGLGYISSQITYTVDGDGTPQTFFSDTPTSAPASAQPGTIQWQLGDLSGTVQISGVVTTVIRDISSNFDDAILTNRLRLSYTDSGQPYSFLTTANSVVREPLLQVDKAYVTQESCGNVQFQDNFNDGDTSGWSNLGTIYQYTYRAPTGANVAAVAGPSGLSDISYSAIVSSTDATGDLGLIFHYQDANHYYRLRYSRLSPGGGGYYLERVENSVPTVLASGGTAGYSQNRWYHLEVRTRGNLYQAFIDGAQVLSTSESSPPWTSGRIGVYTSNEQYAYFDDVWVTTFDEAGCFVGYGDLITYTLGISNQWPLDAYDLHLIDRLPAGTSLVSYNLESDDPATVVVGQPAPIPGATGDLVWDFNQLAASTPYVANQHTALTVTVVISVSPAISASLVLANQALLTYDSQVGDGPASIQRTYSGGSHSNAVQTVTPSIIKSGLPITATIGETVDFTITLPTQPISATLYDLTVSDPITDGLILLPGSIHIDGGVGGVDQSSGNNLQAHFDSLPAMTQAQIHFTAVVKNILGNQEGEDLPNSAVLNWDTQPPIVSNQTSTALVEPTLVVSKTVAPSSAALGDTVFYTLRIYHAPGDAQTAYNVYLSDLVPMELDYVPGTLSLYSGPTGSLDDSGAPVLAASFQEVDATWTVTRPIRVAYSAVVRQSVSLGSWVENTAQVEWTSLPDDLYGETRDGSGGVNDYLTQSQAQLAIPEIGIEKTGPLTTTAGGPITYTLTVKNYGPEAAPVVVTDTMPFQVTALNAVPDQGACTITPVVSGDLVVCDLGDLAPGETTILVNGTVDADTPLGADLTNRAVISTTSADGLTTNNTAEVDTEVYTRADVSLQKTGLDNAIAGETAVYTITVTNNGPSVASRADVKDSLPPGLSYLSASSSQGACVSAICQLGDLPVGASASMVITALVGSDVTGVVTNTAQVFMETRDDHPENNQDNSATSISAQTKLEISKVDLTDPVYAGETYLYEIVVTNQGPSDAENVTIVDTLPTEVAFEGSSPECSHDGSPAGGQVTCAFGTLKAGESRDYLVNVRLDAGVQDGAVGVNTVSVTTSTPVTPDSTLQDEESTTYLQKIGNPADLALTKSVEPASVIAGSGRFTYTLTAVNNGPATAGAVQVVDAYPRDFDFVSAVTSNGSLCNQGMTCDLGDLSVGATVNITLVVDVPAGVLPGEYTNAAHVGSASPDANPANNDDDVTTTVIAHADLQIEKWADPDPATPGESLTYYLEITNLGPSVAGSVVVSDTLPAGFIFHLALAGQGACTLVGSLLTCDLGDLDPGAEVMVHVLGAASSSATDVTLVNTATVTSTTPGVGDEAAVSPGVIGDADLALIKTGTPTAQPGQVVSYTITLQNLGPRDAQDVTLTDQLPVGLNFSSVSPSVGCSQSSGVVTCLVGTLSPFAQRAYVVYAVVDLSVPPGTSLENNARVSSSTSDGNSLNNSDTADTSIVAFADLGIAKQTVPDPVLAGGTITYTIIVTNYGPSPAQAVQLWDFLPAGVTLVDITPSQGGCAQVFCLLDDMAVGQTVTVRVVGRVKDTLLAGSVIRNRAQVASATTDPGPHLNSAEVTNIIASLADVSVQKSHTGALKAGQTLAYTLLVRNLGPSASANIILTDTLPNGLSYVGSTGNCVLVGSTPDKLRCLLGDLAGEAQASFQVTVFADPGLPSGVLTNTVDVTTSTPENSLENNHAEDPATVSTLVDLRLEKAASPNPVVAGEIMTYTLTAGNSGPSLAQSVVVTDSLPSQVSFIDSDASCSLATSNPDVVVCSLGDLGVGTNVVFHVHVLVSAQTLPGASLVNQATVGSVTPETSLDNNRATAITSVVASADLAVDKTCPPGALVAGELVTYTIVVTNTGPSTSRDVDLKDFLPEGLTPVSAAVESGEPCLPTLCQLGDLQPGGTARINVVARVDADITTAGPLENRATVFTDTADPVSENNSDSCSNSVESFASLRMDKRDLVDPVAQGGLLIYEISVANDGPSDAQSVVVSDTLPAGVQYLNSTDHCVESPSGLLTCSLDEVGAKSEESFLVTVLVAADIYSGTLLTNRAFVTTTTPLTGTSILTDVEETLVIEPATPPADLAVVKDVNPATAVAGQDTVQFTLTVTNLGPATATDVELIDPLPDGLSLVSATPSQGFCWDALDCSIGVLSSGGSATVQILALMNADVVSGTVITNTALVRGSQSDPHPENNRYDASVVAETLADISVRKSDDPDPVVPGNELHYTVVITNAGPSDAHSLRLRDILPDEVSFNAADPMPASGPAPYTWELGTLPAGLSTTVEILVNVNPSITQTFTNTVQVDSSDPDPDPQNNTDAEPTGVTPQADLSILKTGDPGAVMAGGQITYTLLVHNSGPSDADGVQVKDYLPAEVTFLHAAPVQAGGPDPLTWNLGKLGAGESRSITLTVSLDASAVDDFTNTSEVEAATPDPHTENNQDSEVTHVIAIADLSVVKQAFPQIVDPEEPLQYLITVHNAGPTPAQNVTVTDLLPDDVSYVSATPAPDARPHPWVWNLGTMLVGETRSITLTVFVEAWASDTFTNTVFVASDTPDPNEHNNRDDVSVVAGVPTGVQLDYLHLSLSEPYVVEIEWAMNVERLGTTFQIYRASTPDMDDAQVIGMRISPDPQGNGAYTLVDKLSESGTYWYWLVVEDSLGRRQVYPADQLNLIILHLPLVRKESR